MINLNQEMTQVEKHRPNWRQLYLSLTGRCPHWAMSSPLTLDGETFRACVACGARRKFNLDTWQEEGRYYFPADTERENSGNSNLS